MSTVSRRPAWLAAAGIVAAVAFGPGLLDWVWISWHQISAGRRLSALKTQHAELAAEQQRLTSDPLYVEDLARSTLKVSQKDEIVIPLHSSQSSRR